MLNQSTYVPIYSYSTNDYPSNPAGFDRYHSRTDHCLVCHDRASGIHFGVSTCEACKAFFRRTNLSTYSIPHPCSPVRCEITIENRNNCPSCRFDKCKRLGMDRENVIYGKPSKQQNQSFYQHEHLTNFSNELIQIFENLHSLEHKQEIERFRLIVVQYFYEQSSCHEHSSNVIHRVLHLLFDSYKNNLLCNSHLNLRMVLALWLFVYYYETFLFQQNISSDKLTMLIKLLDIELNKIHQHHYYGDEQTKVNFLRIDFLNTFTNFADLLQD